MIYMAFKKTAVYEWAIILCSRHNSNILVLQIISKNDEVSKWSKILDAID